MLQISNTPNYAGVTITGDFHEFDLLYDSLHLIVGEEGEYPLLDNARIRVLGLCYDLRHANMGDRDFIFADHGIDTERMKAMGVVGPTKNLYLSFPVFYPEILFIVMALNDFIKLHARNKAKHPEWDRTIMTVRNFQAAFVHHLSEILSPQKFKMMVNKMNSSWNFFDDYYTQYLDRLNIRFLNWDKDKRLENISRMAKRIAEKGSEYQKTKQQIIEFAQENGVSPDQVEFKEEYPEEIDW